MKRTWVYGTVAGLALLAGACADTGAPGNTGAGMTGPAGTAGTYNAPGTNLAGVNPGNGAGDGTWGYYGATVNNAGFRGTNAGPMTQNRSLYVRGGNTANMPLMGYARVDSTQLRTNAAPGYQVYVDRDALARLVGEVTASVPGCMSSQVLVTDEEIFVGLTPQQNQNANTILAQARMNAQAVAPRYYKVYCTTNQGLIEQMARIAGTAANVNANGLRDDRNVDRLVRQFGGVADGDEMNRGKSGMKSRQGGATSR